MFKNILKNNAFPIENTYISRMKRINLTHMDIEHAHARTHARTLAYTHARAHTHTHTHTHKHIFKQKPF